MPALKWTTVEDLRPHLDPIAARFGRMPSQKELKRLGRDDLRHAVAKLGGQRGVAQALGYAFTVPQSWLSVDDLRVHLDPLVDELGHMPRPRYLVARGRHDLNHAISKFEGYSIVASALGYPYSGRRSWKHVEDLRPHLQPIADSLEHMPTSKELRAHGRGDLEQVIAKFGGRARVANDLGYPLRPPEVSPSLEDLSRALEPFVIHLGRMSTKAELLSAGETPLTAAIARLGGYAKVAQALDVKHLRSARWPTPEDLRTDLEPVLARLGRFPTAVELTEAGQGDLLRGIERHGGFARVGQALGYPVVGAEKWTKVEDLRPHLSPIVTQLGRMPTQQDLKARHRGDLNGAIHKLGGFGKVATALGYAYKGKRFIRSVEELRPVLQPLVDELGRMPSHSDLTHHGLARISQTVQKFGGLAAVAEELGFPYEKQRAWQSVEDLRPYLQPMVHDGVMPSLAIIRTRHGEGVASAVGKFGGIRAVSAQLGFTYGGAQTWASIDDLRAKLDPIVNELGRMPTTRDLRDRDRTDLVRSIGKFGGFPEVAIALGYPYTGPKSWSRLDDLRTHLQPYVDELGRMPSQPFLVAKGRSDLISAIHKFGGFRKVAHALGYQFTGMREWLSVEELREYLDPLVKDLGRMPTQGELGKRGLSGVGHAVGKFGGYAAVANSLGYRYQALGSWKRVEALRSPLQPIVDELGRMPRESELLDRGRGDLVGAISKFGGLKKVAESLGFPYVGYQSWTTVEDLRPHLDPIVEEIGRMPGKLELVEHGRHDLTAAINKFGGYPTVAEALGYRYTGPKWRKSVEDLQPELGPIVAELGRMPTVIELINQGRTDLINAIGKFGGFPAVAEALGYPYMFASGREKRQRLRDIEPALLQLHGSRELLPGQVILLLRAAGVLSWGSLRETWQRLQVASGGVDPTIEEQLDRLSHADPSHEVDDAAREWCKTSQIEQADQTIDGRTSTDGHVEFEMVGIVDSGAPGRTRETEQAELRGWSALGRTEGVEISASLIRLSVSRLKTAFYGFANEVRGSLEAPQSPPSPGQIDELTADLKRSAFGEYGDLLSNELVRAASDAYIADLVNALLLPRREAEYVPRLYQLDGARFVAERVRSADRSFGLLFDQPGMGKTLTALWGLAAGGARRFLIVAPLSVKQDVWTPGMIRQVFHDFSDSQIATSLPAALALSSDGPGVAVLHYAELLHHDAIRLLTTPQSDALPPFDVLVFDEAHEVKVRLSTPASPGPLRTGAWLLRSGARACIGLTATPVVNELYEPVSLLQLVQGQRGPDAARRLQSRRLKDRVDVMEYLLADSLRRLKADVLFEIPPRSITIRYVVPDAELLEQIRTFLNRGRRFVTSHLPEYRRLMLEAKLDWVTGATRSQLQSVSPDGIPDPKTLVLCYNVDGVSRRVHERLVHELGADRVLHVDGTTPPAERKEAFKLFRAPATAEDGVAVLVGSVGIIGVGVTLFDPDQSITPHRVIFADLPYTWAEFKQGVDRLHRVGQRFPVTVDVPLVTFGDQLPRADGEPLPSFDEWVWNDLLGPKQRLSDQVLDAAFDVSAYSDRAIRNAIKKVLDAVEQAGGVVLLPPPPVESAAAQARREVGRLRGMPRKRAAQRFNEPGASEAFLAANDASASARLAQRLVRERLGRWLDQRSVVVDLGCGSNPLRDLRCQQVIGIDRHGVNGGLIGDSADTGLSTGEADFVVMSLSMWGTPEDRLAYLREAKRLLRPIGKLVVVEPVQSFGGAENWKAGVARLADVVEHLGMRLAEHKPYTVDAGTSLLAFVIDNSSASGATSVDPDQRICSE